MAYSMKDLQTITGKPPQTINRLMRLNKELIALLPEHRTKLTNGKVFYDDAILEWLKDYFSLENNPAVSNDVAPDEKNNTDEENPVITPPPPVNEVLLDELRRQIDELEEQISSKDTQILNLEKELSAKEAERLHLLTLTTQLTALLAAEKQEKQKLLPAPKPSFSERLRSIFGKNRNKETSNNE